MRIVRYGRPHKPTPEDREFDRIDWRVVNRGIQKKMTAKKSVHRRRNQKRKGSP